MGLYVLTLGGLGYLYVEHNRVLHQGHCLDEYNIGWIFFPKTPLKLYHRWSLAIRELNTFLKRCVRQCMSTRETCDIYCRILIYDIIIIVSVNRYLIKLIIMCYSYQLNWFCFGHGIFGPTWGVHVLRAHMHHLLTMKRQWTYGPTQLPWNDHFHTSLACFTAL